MFNNIVTYFVIKNRVSGEKNAVFFRTNAFVRSDIDLSQADATGKIYYYEKHDIITSVALSLFAKG